MQTVYYSAMRNILAGVIVVAGICGVSGASAQQTQSAPGTGAQQAQPAPTHSAFVDSHEGVTIGIDPWTSASKYKGKFPKKSPYTGGIVALHFAIRNDNDEPIRLNRERIRLLVQLDEQSKQELQPMSADDVADVVLLENHQKDPTMRRLPFPIPTGTGGVKTGRDKSWTELRDACQNLALPSPVIGPHSTMEGLAYFDLRGEFDLLQNARVYVPDLERMTTKQAISYFDIAFNQDSSN